MSSASTTQTNKLSTLVGYGLIILALIAGLKILYLSPLQADSYTHLAIGKYILTHHRIPQHTDVSFKNTQPSLEWISHSWLADTILYIAATPNVQLGVITLLFSTLIVSAMLLLFILDALHIPTLIASSFTSLSIILSLPYWHYHPFIFAVPLMLGFILLSVLAQNSKQKYLWFIPVFFVLWANLCGGYIFLPAGLVLCMLTIHVMYHMPITVSKIFTALGVYMVSLFVSLLNPASYRIYLYLLTIIWSVSTRGVLSTLPNMLKFTNQPIVIDIPTSFYHEVFAIYLMLITLLFLIVLIRYSTDFKKSIVPLAPVLLTAVLALTWVRFLPFAAFGLAPIAAVCLVVFAKKSRLIIKNTLYASFCIAPLTIVCYVLVKSPVYFPFTPPSDQIHLIKSWELPANILTSYDVTGYTLYSLTNTKTLLDAQDDLYDENETLAFSDPAPSVPLSQFQSIVKTNSIQTILVTPDIGGIALAANADPDWALLYFDTNGYIFVKRDAVTLEFLAQHEIQYLDLSHNLGFDSKNIDNFKNELIPFVKTYPQSILAKGELATIYRIEGDFAAADTLLFSIPVQKRTIMVKTEIGRLKAAEGKCGEAELWLLSALADRQEKNFARASLDLGVLYAVCFNDKAKAQHYFSRFNSYILDPAERESLRQTAAKYGVSLDEQ